MAQKPRIRVPGSAPKGHFAGNTIFTKDQKYYSADDRYFMLFQSDGNLVVCKVIGTNNFKPIWNTHTNGKAVKSCVFQKDGNLVLYDYTGKATWDAFTDTKNKNNEGLKRFAVQADEFFTGVSILVMQSDGNLVIYTGGVARWNAGSFEKN